MVATAAWCSRVLAQTPYDVALNLGVCGSFDPALVPGRVVHVVCDRIAELGAEDGGVFLPIEQLGLPADYECINQAPPENAALAMLPRVRGITVNTVHGNDRSIAETVRRFSPQVESMEGAAFMYACTIAGVAYAQVRAVSNVVERRNRAAWKLLEAIDALGHAALDVLADV
jgi:futalosine hydrolase